MEVTVYERRTSRRQLINATYVSCRVLSPGGTISNILQSYGRFKEEVIKRYMKQLFEGVEYIHSKLLIHRDIKGLCVCGSH